MDYNSIMSTKIQGIAPSGIRKFFDILNEMGGRHIAGVSRPVHALWHASAPACTPAKGTRNNHLNAGMLSLRTRLISRRRFDLRPRGTNPVTVNWRGHRHRFRVP